MREVEPVEPAEVTISGMPPPEPPQTDEEWAVYDAGRRIAAEIERRFLHG